MGQLGDSNPQQLLDTIVYYCGLHFTLRSNRDHRQLRRSPAQIEVLERPGERPLLRYTEDVSKNHPGGLKARNVTPKVVYHHSNLDNPEQCFVRMFKKYMSLLPPDAPARSFYLKPASKPMSTCWYSCRPVGHNPISATVARLCRVQDEPFTVCDLNQKVVSVRCRRATRNGEDWSSQSYRRSFIQTDVRRAV